MATRIPDVDEKKELQHRKQKLNELLDGKNVDTSVVYSADEIIPLKLEMTESDQSPVDTDIGVNIVYNDQDTGWAWVVLCSCFMTFCLLGAALFAVGIIHVTLLERYSANISITSWAGALHSSLISLGGPLSSAISERFSCRAAIVTAGVLYTIGYFITAFAPSIEVAIVSCGVIAGTAGGISFTANMVVVGYYFKQKRNIAMGLSVAGVGLGLFIITPLMLLFKEYYGSFGFFIMLSALYANMITFGTLCFPSKLELHSKRKRELNLLKMGTNQSVKCSVLLRYMRVLTNKGILCYCFVMFNFCLSVALLYLYFPDFIVNKNFTAAQAAFFVSISGIFNVVGRVVSGTLANFKRVNEIVIYSGTIGLIGAISFVYPFIAEHYAGQVTYFVLLGLVTGPCIVLTPSVSLKFVAMEDIATAIGLEFAFGGVGALIGPVFAGVLIDNGGTYEQAIIAAACCAIVGSVFGGATLCFQQKPKEKIEITIDEESVTEEN